MLNPKITNCSDCNSIQQMLNKIDVKIFDISKNMYNNMTLMLNKKIEGDLLNDLLHYKRILMYKYYNPEYIINYTLEMISNKVRILTIGVKKECLCEDNITYEITTTTTTTTIII